MQKIAKAAAEAAAKARPVLERAMRPAVRAEGDAAVNYGPSRTDASNGFPRQPSEVESLGQKIAEELGAPDGAGDMSQYINMQKDAAIRQEYKQGLSERAGPINAFVSGSGNTQAKADALAAKAAALEGGTWEAIEGGSWLDNGRLITGLGVRNTPQTLDVARTLGRLDGGKMMTHSQGDLSTLTAVDSIKRDHPEVIETSITSIGSPLGQAYTQGATRVTGQVDPIQVVRGPMSTVFAQAPMASTTVEVTGGHGGDNYLDKLAAMKKSSAAPSPEPSAQSHTQASPAEQQNEREGK
ncbi:hypothetical protein [Rugamonas sp. DEMB1]|uniref:hypothetical protein n=1 Tax=Rugamonas sp. DEMB1 TaxID=3039386 RepID=UPI00244B03D5|nr:hypothetical protein [Rugamonas sp. DEMB1]WGG49420.1 hypothetical protein QC826_23025 [Rugamonas sp. DEMB1]